MLSPFLLGIIMIFDKIENFNIYKDIHPLFPKAIEWFNSLNLNTLEWNTRIEIDGKKFYALMQDYFTAPSYTKNFEGHKKYIDIQIMINGAELMETALLTGKEEFETAYLEEKDIYKVKTQEETKILLKEGYFAIFFAQDLHKPCLNYSFKSERVKKIVLKILK